MYVRKSLTSSLVPPITGWFGQANPFAFDVKWLEPAANARHFQAGTPPIPVVYGATEGVRLLLGAGTANVVAHVTLLAAKLLKGTAEVGAAKTLADSVGAFVVLKAHDSDALVKVFAENGFVVSNRLDGLRISFHRYNSLEEVRALLELLDKNVDRPVTSKQLCTAASKQ